MSLTLTAVEIAGFPTDKGICHKSGRTSLIVYKSGSGELKVTQNSCLHLGQSFSPDVEDAGLMKCTAHNAKLDPKTMTYTASPTWMAGMGQKTPVGAEQPCYTVTMNADGSATLTPPESAGKGGCEIC